MSSPPLPRRASSHAGSSSLPIFVADASPEPRVLGEPLLRAVDSGFLHLERWLRVLVPDRWNPIAQAGAIANVAFIVASATGVLLLVWYVPSVNQAWSSVEAMGKAPLTAGLVRSLHRYSSDGCMLFVLVHALRLFAARRFGGARWLAWVTGISLVGLLWFVGWLGYWLVWDERAHQVAVATARPLDLVPIFAEPLSRSFLIDEAVNSLLFFVVFFLHMLIPLAMGVALWLHITRLNRPRFLTDRPMTAWVVGSMVVLSLAYPATSAPPARMLQPPTDLAGDGWFLLPLTLAERLSGGAIWAATLVGGLVLFSVPWWMARRRAAVVEVDTARCNACRACVVDCPYGAITMVPRKDGRAFPLEPQVDPSRCVGCGICVGACGPGGIGLPEVPVRDARRHVEGWIGQAAEEGEEVSLAVLCAGAAGGGLRVDPASGRCGELPGYRVLAVPCAGWLPPTLVERALRRGAAGVLVVSCPPASGAYREGHASTAQRLAGEGAAESLPASIDPARVRQVALDRTRRGELIRVAREFREEGVRRAEAAGPPPGVPAPGRGAGIRARVAVGAAAISLVSGALVAAGSEVPLPLPGSPGPELVVSFELPGQVAEDCREPDAAESAARPVHMRQAKICERARVPVRLRVTVDGRVVLERSYPPRGIWGDGNSLALEHLPVEPGTRRVEVAIGASPDGATWDHVEERILEFGEEGRRVALFEKGHGFGWH
ncbi:hydrogenase iron-sulfur subunit [Myxococcota bacterium]|nr:hydrogenase iron-sulfur subunit [Myxococcota bacterium]